MVAIIPKRSSAHYGASFHSTLDSEPGTKAGNFAGAIWSCKLILKQAEKSWFGWQKEGARLAKDWKVHTSDILIRKYLPREQSSPQSDISRISKATEEAKTPTSPFFLTINHNAWRTKSTWYKVSPRGKNQIGQFLPKAAKKAGLQACGRKLSNHSVRKTSISRLLDADIPENFVTQLSGRKNLQSLSSYKSASLAHQ